MLEKKPEIIVSIAPKNQKILEEILINDETIDFQLF